MPVRVCLASRRLSTLANAILVWGLRSSIAFHSFDADAAMFGLCTMRCIVSDFRTRKAQLQSFQAYFFLQRFRNLYHSENILYIFGKIAMLTLKKRLKKTDGLWNTAVQWHWGRENRKKRKNCNNGVFHVFHVNRSVNIFLLNRKIFYVTKIC